MKKTYCCIISLCVIAGAAVGYIHGAAAVDMMKSRETVGCILKSKAKKAFKTVQKKVGL